MPIYVYECQSCGQTVEVIQKMSDPPLSKCEECDGEMKKVMAPSNAHFKGAGWAADGYDKATMGKVGPKVTDVQGDMVEVGEKAAKTGGHEEGRKAVNKYLDKLQGKP